MIAVHVVAFVIGALVEPLVRRGLIYARWHLARPGYVMAPVFFPSIGTEA